MRPNPVRVAGQRHYGGLAERHSFPVQWEVAPQFSRSLDFHSEGSAAPLSCGSGEFFLLFLFFFLQKTLFPRLSLQQNTQGIRFY